MPNLPLLLSSPLLEPLARGPLHLSDVSLAELLPEILGSSAASLRFSGVDLRMEGERLLWSGHLSPGEWLPGLPADPWNLSGHLDSDGLKVEATGSEGLSVGPLKASGLFLRLEGPLERLEVNLGGRLDGPEGTLQLRCRVEDPSRPPVFVLDGDLQGFGNGILRSMLGTLAPAESSLPSLGSLQLSLSPPRLHAILNEPQELPAFLAGSLGIFRADIPTLPLLELRAAWEGDQGWMEGNLGGTWSIPIQKRTLEVDGPSFRLDAAGLKVEGAFRLGQMVGHLQSVWAEPIRVRATMEQIPLGALVRSLLPAMKLPTLLEEAVLGGMTVEVLPDSGQFSVEGHGTPVRLRLPLPELNLMPYLSMGLDKVLLIGGSEHADHRLEIQGTIAVENLPESIQKFLHPSVTGALRVDRHGAHLALPMVIAPLDIPLGPLGIGHLEISDVDLRLGLDTHITAELGFGIPEGANLHFAHVDKELFNTFRPEDPSSQVRLSFSADPLEGISLQLRSSPLKAMVCTPEGEGIRAVLDLGELGKLRMLLPTFRYKEGRLRAQGAFDTEVLTPSIAHLRALLRMAGLASVAESLPDANQESHRWMDNLLNHPRAPEGVKLWAHPPRPESFIYDVSIASTGPLEADLQTVGAPLSALFPTMGPNGPRLVGLALSRLALGASWTAPISRLRLNARLESFDLLPMFGGLLGVQSQGNQHWRRLEVDDLWVVSIYNAGVGFVAPLFFKEIGLSWRGVQGMEMEAHASLPVPEASGADLLFLLSQTSQFLRTEDGRLDPDHPPRDLDLRFTIGPTYIKLPEVFGGAVLGAPSGLPPVSAYEKIAHLLNGFKELDLEESLLSIDRTRRAGHTEVALGPIRMEGWWLLTSAEELRRGSWHTVDIPEEQVATVAGLLGDQGDRLAAVVTGGWNVAGLSTLHVTLGFLLTDGGFRGSLCLSGNLADGLIRLAAGGMVIWDESQTHLDVQMHLHVGELPAFQGQVRMGQEEFSSQGEMQLWLAEDVGLVGELAGSLSADGLLLRGRGQVVWGDWQVFPEARFVVSDQLVQVYAEFLEETVVLDATPKGSTVHFSGPFEKTLELPGFKLHPGLLHLVPAEGTSPLGLATTVELLGFSSSTILRFGPKGFEFDTLGMIAGLCSSELRVNGGNIRDPGSFSVEGRLHIDPQEPLPIQRLLNEGVGQMMMVAAEASRGAIEAADLVVRELESFLQGVPGLERAEARLHRLAAALAWKERRPGEAPITLEDAVFQGGLVGPMSLTVRVRVFGTWTEEHTLAVDLSQPVSWAPLLAERLTTLPHLS